MENRERQVVENMITPWKILANLKAFWWFCLIPLALCGFIVYRNTMSSYTEKVNAAARDTYIASALVYVPTVDEETGRGNMVIFKSQTVLDQVDQVLAAQGYAVYDAGKDYLEVNHTMASYGLTLVGEGKDRMQCMMQALAESIVEVMEETTGLQGHIVDNASVKPCTIDSSHKIQIYEDASQKKTSLSLGDFLAWKNMMILCAGVFLGLALIFVAILFDQKIRSREELEAFCPIPCLGVIGNRKEKDKKLILSLIRAMCTDRQASKLMLVSVSAEKLLPMLAEQCGGEGYVVTTCENAAKDAETMEQCRQQDAVVLTVRKNVDSVVTVKRALANLEMIRAQVIGYIMTE